MTIIFLFSKNFFSQAAGGEATTTILGCVSLAKSGILFSVQPEGGKIKISQWPSVIFYTKFGDLKTGGKNRKVLSLYWTEKSRRPSVESRISIKAFFLIWILSRSSTSTGFNGCFSGNFSPSKRGKIQ